MNYILTILLLSFISCGSIPSAQEIVDAVKDSTDTTTSEDTTDTASDSTDTVDSEQESSGHNVDVHGIVQSMPQDAQFIGTFEESYTYSVCANVPTIVRLYSSGDTVYFQDSKGHLVWSGAVFQDGTFNFDFDYVTKFGNWASTQACTCAYYQPYQGGDYFSCVCETVESVSDYNGSCNLEYDLF